MIFKIDGVQMANPVTYKLEDLKGEKIDGSFYEVELQKSAEEVLRIENIGRRDGQELKGACKVTRLFIKIQLVDTNE